MIYNKDARAPTRQRRLRMRVASFACAAGREFARARYWPLHNHLRAGQTNGSRRDLERGYRSLACVRNPKLAMRCHLERDFSNCLQWCVSICILVSVVSPSRCRRGAGVSSQQQQNKGAANRKGKGKQPQTNFGLRGLRSQTGSG